VSLNRGSSSTVAQTVSLDDLRLTAPGVVGPPPDTTPPSSPTGVTATAEPTETYAVIGWEAATDDVGVVGYEMLRDGVLLPGTVSTSPWFDVTVVPGRTYTYAVRAFDAAGNRSAPSAAAPVTIPLPVDDSPPSAPTGLTASAATTTSAVLSWDASTDDVGVTAYDVLRDGSVVASVSGTSFTDTTLSPATAYMYTVRARDAAGNASDESEPAAVTTPAPDASPPSAPTDLTATATTGSSVALSWTASTDDVGVTAYDVLRDGVVVATVAGTTHMDTTVSPVTAYTYTVRARDAAGNTSDPSAPATVTTPDTVAPSVPTGVSAVASSGTSVTVSWSAATDDVGVTAYDVVRDGAPLATVPGTSLVDTAVVAGSTYTYAVRARDAAGNASALSATATVTPPVPVTELYRDTWSLPDGSPWGSAWSAGAGLGGSVSVAAGTGQLAVPGTQNAYARAQLTGVPSVSGADVTFSYRWGSSTNGAYLNIYLRGSGGWQNAYRPRTGYGIELSSNSSTIALRRNVNGTTTTLVSTSGAQQVGTAVQRVRIQVAGSTVRYRTWLASQAEPTTWRATVTDTAVTADGQVFVSLVKGSGSPTARTVQLDDLVVAPAP
jgi:chitodextrinase